MGECDGMCNTFENFKNDAAKERMLTESAVLDDICNSNNAADSIKNQRKTA